MKFQMGVTITEDALDTARLGAGTGAANNLADADNNKLVKLVGDSRYDLCAQGDAIEAQVVSIESATLDGYTVGSVKDDGRFAATADGLQATPAVGTIAVGDYVVAGTVSAKGTAVPANGPKVCKATYQPGTTVAAAFADVAPMLKVAVWAWRVVAIASGTGAVGDALIIERVSE